MTAAFEIRKIEEARDYVRDKSNETQVWVVVLVVGDKLQLSRKGKDYDELFTHLGPEDMAFAYAKIITGDEVSKREKFVLICWAGSDVSNVKRGKMMTLRSEIDKIFDQRAKAIEASDHSDLELSKVKEALIKAGGADYGTSTS